MESPADPNRKITIRLNLHAPGGYQFLAGEDKCYLPAYPSISIPVPYGQTKNLPHHFLTLKSFSVKYFDQNSTPAIVHNCRSFFKFVKRKLL